jgi:hypothetical protein
MSDPEIHFKIFNMTITAKGREAINAIRRPLGGMMVILVPVTLFGIFMMAKPTIASVISWFR